MPLIVPDPLVGRDTAQLDVTCATPGKRMYFIYSVNGEGSTFVPMLGLTIDLAHPQLGGTAITDETGLARLSVKVPSRASGHHVWIQAAETSRKTTVVQRDIQ